MCWFHRARSQQCSLSTTLKGHLLLAINARKIQLFQLFLIPQETFTHHLPGLHHLQEFPLWQPWDEEFSTPLNPQDPGAGNSI